MVSLLSHPLPEVRQPAASQGPAQRTHPKPEAMGVALHSYPSTFLVPRRPLVSSCSPSSLPRVGRRVMSMWRVSGYLRALWKWPPRPTTSSPTRLEYIISGHVLTIMKLQLQVKKNLFDASRLVSLSPHHHLLQGHTSMGKTLIKIYFLQVPR